MRYTKGKWVASNKDTWSVDTTLNKIIYAYIQKLYDGLKGSECHGVPMYYRLHQRVYNPSLYAHCRLHNHYDNVLSQLHH